jgi:lipopolysaccharide transport system ATP-binding protein
MSDTVIRVENLGKKYIIGHQQQERYTSLRDVIANKVKSLGSLINPKAKVENPAFEEFWALKDVSFEIKQGDRVGIIGRNGAGKSTLLKILSRITEPTQGNIKIKGRVASLLEVGTGFHPELTGRENIFLNGAILGMGKEEIKRKFDEIVAFAEVEKFLDTPVKRYSSGMYVRLAFAVAAHLEPEILIVDEVLAVGDAEFQKKCLGKMRQFSKEEQRTVIFVSHQLNAIQQLCNRAILLSKGTIIVSSTPEIVIQKYLGANSTKTSWTPGDDTNKIKDVNFTPISLSLVDEKYEIITDTVKNTKTFGIVIEGYIGELNPALTVGFALYSEDRQLLFWSLASDSSIEKWPQLEKGFNKLICWLPQRFLNEGKYEVHLIASIHCFRWIAQPLSNSPYISFNIKGCLSDSPLWVERRPGLLSPVLNFERLI